MLRCCCCGCPVVGLFVGLVVVVVVEVLASILSLVLLLEVRVLRLVLVAPLLGLVVQAKVSSAEQALPPTLRKHRI
jgi:hypothetical protein